MYPVELLGVLQLLLEAEAEIAQLDATEKLILSAQFDHCVLQVREMLGEGQGFIPAEKVFPPVANFVTG